MGFPEPELQDTLYRSRLNRKPVSFHLKPKEEKHLKLIFISPETRVHRKMPPKASSNMVKAITTKV